MGGFGRWCGVAVVAVLAGAVPAWGEAAKSGLSAPAQAYADYLAGRIARGAGDWDNAAKRLTGALRADPANTALARQAFLIQLGEGRYGEALDLAARLKAAGADSFLAGALQVSDLLAKGKPAEARTRLADVPTDGLGQFVVPLLAAWVEVAAGQPDAALAKLSVLEQTPGFVPLHRLQAALIEDMRGNGAAAGELYAKALEGGTPLRLMQLVGNFHERAGRADAARALYLAVKADNPDSLAADEALARLDAGSKGGGPASRPLVADAKDGLAEALFELASAMHQESAQEMALMFGRLSQFLRADQPLARIMTGDVLQARTRHADALAEYQAAAGVGGSAVAWMARLRQADMLRRLDRAAEATRLLEAMAAERPDRSDALARLGDVLRGQERYAEAADAYTRALDRLGDKPKLTAGLLYVRGMSLDAAGRWPEAEADLKRSLELSPDNASILNYLGYSWADRGLNLPQARTLLEKAVSLKPDDGYIIDSLGWVKFKQGDVAGAVELLERAVELHPLDPAMNDHLGDAYWAAGRKQEARFQWTRAAQQSADTDLKQAAEDKLRNGLPLPKTAETVVPKGEQPQLP